MRVSARLVKGIVLSLIAFFVTTTIAPSFSTAYAQTITPEISPTPTTTSSNPYLKPYADNNVPQNQHILSQAIFIEVLAALGCQLAGIDLVSPSQSCLGVNPQTEKLGFANPQNGQPPIGGILGIAANGIGVMFTPTYGTGDYIHYMADNFGVVKSAYAAEGFVALTPILKLWEASRNIAYFLLIVAFIFIGIGVMLRIKIDPRTVMTIQNKIPDVIIAIILITFSYAFSGLMVDLMWTTTYIGINTITTYGGNPTIPDCTANPPSLNSIATKNILESPLYFVDRIFVQEKCGVVQSDVIDSGIFDLSRKVGYEVAGLESDLIKTFIGVDPTKSCEISNWVVSAAPGGDSITDCPRIWFANIFGYFASILWFIIIFIVILITVFRIWFELLRAYALSLMYPILGPIFIVMGLLPKKPLGFERWVRVFSANLAVFPATAALLVLARTFMSLFSGEGAENRFVPPLVGSPNLDSFGAILGFAVLLMAPQLTSLLREKLGVPPVKQVGAALGTIAAGRAAVAAPVQRTWQHLNRRNPQTGAPLGIVASLGHQAGQRVRRAIPIIGGRMAAREDYRQTTHNIGAGRPTVQQMRATGQDTRSFWEQRRDRQNLQASQQQAGQRMRAAGNPQMNRNNPYNPLNYTPDNDGSRRWSLHQQMAQQQQQYRTTPTTTLAASIERLREALTGMGDRGWRGAPPTVNVQTTNAQAANQPTGQQPTSQQPPQGNPPRQGP